MTAPPPEIPITILTIFPTLYKDPDFTVPQIPFTFPTILPTYIRRSTTNTHIQRRTPIQGAGLPSMKYTKSSYEQAIVMPHQLSKLTAAYNCLAS